jgi:hypothetical protein
MVKDDSEPTVWALSTILEEKGMRRLLGRILLAAITTACASTPASLPASPPSLELGSIPFDEPLDEVMAAFQGMETREDKTPYIEAIGDYVLEDYLEGGLVKDEEKGNCFYPDVVKKYVVTYPDSSDLEELTLYFQGFDAPKQPYRLFMIKKKHSKPEATVFNFRSLYHIWEERIASQVESEPAVHEGTYQQFTAEAHAYYSPALVGVWDRGETLVFLMVADSKDGALGPEIAFISSSGLARYLKECKFMSGGPVAK